ncbi:hypothetical protein QQ045_014766 [Rhodiola kirilowii]
MTGSHNLSEFARKYGSCGRIMSRSLTLLLEISISALVLLPWRPRLLLSEFKNFLHGDDTNPKIWILWKDHVKVSHIGTRDQYISISASTLASSPITITFVYAAIAQARRLLLWDQLENFARTLAGPWIVAGDFNVISSWNEKKGGARRDNGAMAEFNEFQLHAGLANAGYVGNDFTWCNNRSEEHQLWMRLDRVLINGATMAMLPNFLVEHLPRISSDHAPLLIKFGESPRKPASFKYLRAWHEHADFLPLVEAEWPKHTHANPILAIALKLKGLSRRLKSWNGLVFGNLKVKIKGLTATIDALEADLQNRWSYNVEGEIARSKELVASTQRLHYQVLADKAKAQWVVDGDRNTTLFQALIKARRPKNRVRLHMPDGTFTEDSNIIGHLAQEHFNHILRGFSIRPPEDAFNDVFPMINDDDNEILTTVPGTEEIHGAIRSLNPSSAPGPDGFTGHFFSHCWHIIKDDLARAVGAFFQGTPLPSSISSTNLVLLPKQPIIERMDQLRPISLCNFFHKIISSILNARLRNFLPRLISQEQCGFIPGSEYDGLHCFSP